MKDYLFSEQWREIIFEDERVDEIEKERLLISSFGRVKSYRGRRRNEISKEARLLKGSLTNGYNSIMVNFKDGRQRNKYIHKLVAQTFVPQRNEGEKYVIHIDYDKSNNKVSNLKWVDSKGRMAHQHQNPKRTLRNYKLTEGKVKMIKKKIFNPKRKTRMKMIAKQFGISEMQLYRIKSGENWGHVKID